MDLDKLNPCARWVFDVEECTVQGLIGKRPA